MRYESPTYFWPLLSILLLLLGMSLSLVRIAGTIEKIAQSCIVQVTK